MSVMIAGFILTSGAGPGASYATAQALIATSFAFALAGAYRLILPRVASVPEAVTCAATIVAGATLAYVLVWELYLYVTDYVFIHGYIEQRITLIEAQNLTDTVRSKKLVQTRELQAKLLNTSYRLWTTTKEIAPTGFAVVLPGCLTLYGLMRKAKR